MLDDRETLVKAVEWLMSGEQVALATVVRTWGASPRPVGSHMAIRSDGLFVGSVSAGCIENAVISGALATLDAAKPQILEFGLNAWRNGLSCGGKMSVQVQPLADPTALQNVIQALDNAHPCALAFDSNSTTIEFLGIECVDNLQSAPQSRFIRPYRPAPRLVIAGAVHIAQSLSVMARLAGYAVTIIDPRREFAVRDGFDTTPIVSWPDAYFMQHPVSNQCAIISLTHTPKIDHPTMVAALRSQAFYIGALGSRKTHAKRLSRLSQEGYDESQLKRIHAPIGLPIKALSPAEIAVSILAEIVAVRRSA